MTETEKYLTQRHKDHKAVISSMLSGVNLKCMEMLDAANTGAYGNPEPVLATFKVEKGLFIVITGHDICYLQMLLE